MEKRENNLKTTRTQTTYNSKVKNRRKISKAFLSLAAKFMVDQGLNRINLSAVQHSVYFCLFFFKAIAYYYYYFFHFQEN